MTKGLVSEARPIPWDQLLKFEDRELKKADDWIQAVLEDADREKPGADEIDERRSGRVLLIDGPRGSGKTSLLLTLLKHWGAKKVTGKLVGGHEHLHIFLPILDFDPLPPAMPLHGWLLEPWRDEIKKLGRNLTADSSEDDDLSEIFVALFERVVSGWTPPYAESKSVVEKAMAYQEQASGWIETTKKWGDFVGAMLCRKAGCSDARCRGKHEHVFVISIDDVDLQVERLPELVHALRLLRHPNVAYVLTGNYKHLQFVMNLDYINRHTRRLNRSGKRPSDDELVREIRIHAKRLCDAFLEKALPLHARLELRHLTFHEVLKIAIDDDKGADARKLVSELLSKEVWNGIPSITRRRGVATARQAQHAIDRHRQRSSPATAGATLAFLADLCGTAVLSKGSAHDKPAFAVRGELTTELGPIIQVWKGDRLTLMLTDALSFVFDPDFIVPDAYDAVAANQALLIHSLVATSNPPAVAHALEWTPDAGIASTHVHWEPSSNKVTATAIFHWPWLVPPSATEALGLHRLAARMRSLAGGNSINDLEDSDAMIAIWLMKNLEWGWRSVGKNPESYRTQSGAMIDLKLRTKVDAFGAFVTQFKTLLRDNPNRAFQDDAARWARELRVMTMPYFGLPAKLANNLWKAVDKCGLATQAIKVQQEQAVIVRNAIIAKSVVTQRVDGVDRDLSKRELDEQVYEFLRQRMERVEPKQWRIPIQKGRKST